MKGRKPKPTALQIAEGDPRKKGKSKLSDAARNEIQAQRGLPDCPEHLQGMERKIWTFWVEQLELMDIDRRPDAVMLEGACVNYARAVAADDEVEDRGLIVEEPILNKDGDEVGSKLKANPAVAISAKAWTLVKGFCSEFGFSPVSRGRIHNEAPKDGKDELLSLLSQPYQSRTKAVQ